MPFHYFPKRDKEIYLYLGKSAKLKKQKKPDCSGLFLFLSDNLTCQLQQLTLLLL